MGVRPVAKKNKAKRDRRVMAVRDWTRKQRRRKAQKMTDNPPSAVIGRCCYLVTKMRMENTTRTFIPFLALMVLSGPVHAADYLLSVNGKEVEIALNEGTKITTPKGEELRVLLKQKEYLEFSGKFFKMSHKNILKPNVNNINEETSQALMVTSSGTGVIIQEYSSMDPSPLIDLMVKELIKEEVGYGYKAEEKPIEKVIDGKNLKGKEVVTSYQNDGWVRCVLTAGGKDSGVMIVTMIKKSDKDEQYVIDDFWKSLKLSLK
jgi:hypothetical protein